MTNPPGESIDYIKQYIDASAESADRVRFVLLLMVTASVLALVAFWNSRSDGWPTSRLVVAADAENFYDGKHPITGDAKQVRQKVWPKIFNGERYAHALTQKEREGYLADREQAYKNAKEFVDRARFVDLEHLQRHVEYMERARIEKVLYITVPFFGIVFDINDLGIFAGITFIIILLLFRFSLLRELRNLRLAFLQAKTPEHLRLCYDMLAMQQVLTTPPEIEPVPSERRWGGRWREALWNTVSKGLYLIPFAVLLGIFLHDRDTYPQVEKIFPGTVPSLRISAILLFPNALLTGLCLYLGLKVDKRWMSHARWILDNAPPPVGATDGGDGTPVPNTDTVGETKRGNVPDDPDYEQPEGQTRRAMVGAGRAYAAALLFVCIFVVSTIILLARVGGPLRSTSDATSWVIITVQIVSALASISGAIHGWVKERREAREQKLRIEKLEQELAAREKPALPTPQEKRE